MLHKAFKELFIIVATVILMWLWVQISSQDSVKSIAKTLFQSPSSPWNAGPGTNSTFSETFETVHIYEIFAGQISDLLNATTKVEVPGIVDKSLQRQCELLETSKCTLSGRLGFHVPIQGLLPSPGHPDRVVQSLTNLVLKLTSAVNAFRLKYTPVDLRIRSYFPWDENAPVELGVAWTVAIILYAGICWYERRQQQAVKRMEYKRSLLENLMQLRDAIPEWMIPEDSDNIDEGFYDCDAEYIF